MKLPAAPNRKKELALFRRLYEKRRRQALREEVRFNLRSSRRRRSVPKELCCAPDDVLRNYAASQIRSWEAVAAVIDAMRNQRDEVSFANVDQAAAVMSMALLQWQKDAPLGSVYYANRRDDLYADLLIIGEHRLRFNIGGRLAEVDGLHAPSGEHIRVMVEQLAVTYRENYTPASVAAVRFDRFVEEQRLLLRRRLRAGELVHKKSARQLWVRDSVIIPDAGDRWWLILE